MNLSDHLASSLGRPTARWSSLKTRMNGFVLLTCLILVGLDAQHAWDYRLRTIEKAQHETANLAQSLARNAEDTVDAADASIVGVVQRLEFDGAAPEKLKQLEKIMTIRGIAHPALADLIVCDEAGNRLANAVPASPMDRCITEGEYIQYHRMHSSHDTHLGRPVRVGMPGIWIIPVSRRFNHPDGSFAGVVIAAIDMAHFQNLYGTFEIGRKGSILLAQGDGTLLVRRPVVASKIGSSMLSGPLFHDYLPGNATGIGTAEIESAMDGVTRLMSYHRLDHYPLVVSVTLAKDEVLAGWRDAAAKQLVGAIILCGTIGFFGLRLAAQIEQRQRAEMALMSYAKKLRMNQARLRKTRQHLTRAQELAESGSFERDLRTGQVTWSDNLYRLFGVDRTSFTNSMVSELIHPEDRARFDNLHRDHAAGIAATATEFRIIRPDGACRTIIVDSASSVGEHGTANSLLGTVRDVTRAKAAEAQLRAQGEERLRSEAHSELLRQRFEQAIDSIPQMIVLFDADERVVACNRAFLDLHRDVDGVSPAMESIVGLTFRQTLDLRVRAGLYDIPHGNIEAFIEDRMARFRMIRTEWTFDLADGRSMQVGNRTAPNGGTIDVWTDITGIKAAELQRRTLEDQLHHSQKLEALGTLAGGIAHDLNNALVPTIMMTSMVMEMHAEDSPERTNLALALAGARRATELVRRILTFARKETTEKHEFDLAALVAEAMTMLRASLPATIELISLVKPIPAIFGDSSQLYQAIVNLVTNAAQAIGDEPGKITVTLRPAAGGSHIELTVADTGVGMDEMTKQRIFDPFFTTKAVNEGTGLGLSIVHGIVVAHKGTIAVTGQPGRGSSFSITLPVAGSGQKDDQGTVPAAA
jgi:PAS domain S-box-containing protein